MPKKKPDKQLWNDLGDTPLSPEAIDDMNRQMEDIENQPRREFGEVLEEARRKLQEVIDAQGHELQPGERAVA